ncbi:hypothetical protein TNCV_2240801 [Trichonephila clavipes]|nr:hypothetical protein TNCV_2240801 [Trichonephila clavipes]
MSRRLIPLFIVLRDLRKDEMRKDGTRNECRETPGCIKDQISDSRIEEDSSRRLTSVHDGPNRCPPRAHFNDRGTRMLPQKPDALEYAARQGKFRACIVYQEPNTKRFFVLFAKTIGTKKDAGG